MFNKNQRHGSFTLNKENDTLIVDALGPFNRETILDYKMAVSSAIDAFNGKPWNQLVIMRQESIFTPEAIDEMVAVTSYRMSRGLKFSAVVFIDSVARSLIEHQLSSIYLRVGLDFDFFDDIHSAKKSLEVLSLA
ncbi:hypothetical protein [Colwellia sp. MEBiC06753]